ncbi:MAG: hypothetical protein ACK5RL_19595 [Acidimicrobiales bacterium]
MTGPAEEAIRRRFGPVIDQLGEVLGDGGLPTASSSAFRFVVDDRARRDQADVSAVAASIGVVMRAVTDQPVDEALLPVVVGDATGGFPAATAARELAVRAGQALRRGWDREATRLYVEAAERLHTDPILWFGAGLAASHREPATAVDYFLDASRFLEPDDPGAAAYAAILAAVVAEDSGDVRRARRLLRERSAALPRPCPALTLHLARLGPPRLPELGAALFADPMVEADLAALGLDRDGTVGDQRRRRTEREIGQLNQAIEELYRLAGTGDADGPVGPGPADGGTARPGRTVDDEPRDNEPRDNEPRDTEPRDTEPRDNDPRDNEPGDRARPVDADLDLDAIGDDVTRALDRTQHAAPSGTAPSGTAPSGTAPPGTAPPGTAPSRRPMAVASPRRRPTLQVAPGPDPAPDGQPSAGPGAERGADDRDGPPTTTPTGRRWPVLEAEADLWQQVDHCRQAMTAARASSQARQAVLAGKRQLLAHLRRTADGDISRSAANQAVAWNLITVGAMLVVAILARMLIGLAWWLSGPVKLLAVALLIALAAWAAQQVWSVFSEFRHYRLARLVRPDVARVEREISRLEAAYASVDERIDRAVQHAEKRINQIAASRQVIVPRRPTAVPAPRGERMRRGRDGPPGDDAPAEEPTVP